MKRFLITLFLLATVVADTAAQCCASQNYSFYAKVGTGVSCSERANVCAPYPPWSPATQGYNARLGNAPMASASLGCELFNVVDLEATLANRSIFKYCKFQTSTIGDGSYTRRFYLNVTSILFTANFLGKDICYLNYDTCWGKIYPMVGFGLGMSNLLITNYRTTGLPATGDSSPYLSFSAENQYTLRRNFTYTLQAGIEYTRNDWAINTGYRWFNAGSFRGPQYQRVASGAAVDVGCNAWKMRFRANEWFIEFKIFI